MTHEFNWRLSKKQLKRVGALIFSLLAFFLPYQMEFHVPQLFGVTLTPMNVLGFILLVLLLLKILTSLRLSVVPHWGLWLLFVMMASIAYALGPRVTSSLQGLWVVFRLALVPPLFYIAAVTFLNTSDIRQIVEIMAISAALAGLMAVIQTMSRGQLLSGYLTNHRYLGFLQPMPPEVIADYSDALVTKLYLAGTNIYRGHGTFYSHNGFGAFISVAACLSWGLLRGAIGKRRWFWFVIFVAQVMGSIASFSRSSWSALAAGIGIAIGIEVIQLGRKGISRIIRFLPLLFLLISVIGVVVLRSEKIRDHFITILNPADTPEFAWRQMVWETAVQAIVSHPWIGAGVQDVFTVVDWNGKAISYGAHNLFLGVTYETGIITLIIFLFFIVILSRSAWRYFRHTPLLSDRLLAVGFLGATVAFLVTGISSGLMSIENMAVLFWLMAGLTTTLRREVNQYRQSAKEVQDENLDGRIPAVATSH